MIAWAVMSEVTRLLSAVEQGDAVAAERVLPMVDAALRRLAAAKLAGEPAGHTLDATALVHEAYLRLASERRGLPPPSSPDQDGGDKPRCSPGWCDRGEFL